MKEQSYGTYGRSGEGRRNHDRDQQSIRATLEDRVSRLEATLKILLGILRTMAKALDLEPDEGDFGLSKDESDQLDWLDELEADVDD